MLAAALRAPAEFRFYRDRESESLLQTATLIICLGLELDGRRLLELGPGVGAALDLFRAHGAQTRFIERHPLFALECARRRHRGRCFDFIRHRDRLRPDYDIIYARGSITPANFDGAEDLTDWLAHLEAPTVILSPWIKGPPPDWFTDTLRSVGFRSSGWIDGYSVPDIYPDAWIRADRGALLTHGDVAQPGSGRDQIAAAAHAAEAQRP